MRIMVIRRSGRSTPRSNRGPTYVRPRQVDDVGENKCSGAGPRSPFTASHVTNDAFTPRWRHFSGKHTSLPRGRLAAVRIGHGLSDQP
jgi:hypothetical protein